MKTFSCKISFLVIVFFLTKIMKIGVGAMIFYLFLTGDTIQDFLLFIFCIWTKYTYLIVFTGWELMKSLCHCLAGTHRSVTYLHCVSFSCASHFFAILNFFYHNYFLEKMPCNFDNVLIFSSQCSKCLSSILFHFTLLLIC